MALSRRQLAEALRLTDGTADPSGPVNDILGRLEGVSAAFIELLCPNAPDAIKDEIEVRFVGYLYDMPTAGRGDFYGNAWRNSGAGGLASRWIVRRAGVTAELATDSSGETVSGAWAIGDDEQETAGGGLGMTQQGNDSVFVNCEVENQWYDTTFIVPAGNFYLQASTFGGRSGLQVINRALLLDGTDAVAGETTGGNFPTTVIQTVSHPVNTDVTEAVQISRTAGGNLVMRARTVAGEFEAIPVHVRVFEAA